MGSVDGATTNPSLLAKAGRPTTDVITEICEIVNGPVSAEVIATTTDAILEEGRALAALHPNVVVKVPVIKEGLKAVKALAAEGIQCNVTLNFSPLQALLAAKCGAAYISPFVGRLDGIGHMGMELVEQIREIYDNYDYPTEILAASLRHPMHVVESALAGADVVTMPFKVVMQLIKHPLTDIGLEKFLADYRKSQE